MRLPDFLTEWPHGEIMLTGHRIGLYHVITRYNQGYSAEMLAEHFPTLPLELLRQVIAFYRANREEVDRYVARVRDELDRQSASGKHVDREALRERFARLYPERAREGAEG